MINKYWDLNGFSYEGPGDIIECYGVLYSE